MAWHFISADNFTGEIQIVGLENPNGGSCQTLCDMIDKYEPIYLSQVLGYAFYQEIVKAINIDPDNVDQQILDLMDGADYTYNDILYRWDGLRQHIAEYVYYWYMRIEAPATTGMGQFIPSPSTGSIVSASRKTEDAFNRSTLGMQRCRLYNSTITYMFTDVLPDDSYFDYDVMNSYGL